MKNERKPWLKKDGETLTDAELLEVTQDWGAEGWEEFLVATVEKPLKESLLDEPQDINAVADSYRTAYQDMLTSGDFPQLKAVIRLVLKHLTLREQRVVYGIFWEEKSLRTIAQEMRIGKNTVANLKTRGLEKLGRLLLKKIARNTNDTKEFNGSYHRLEGQEAL